MTLKDELFNREQVNILADLIEGVHTTFNKGGFINDCINTFPPLELKERMSSVRKQLYIYLPEDFITSVEILSEALSNRKQGGFIFGSVLEYIEAYGCTDEYVDYSLKKLGELTSALSSEFAVRPFFNKYPDKTLDIFMKWSKDEDFQIRRLASEGARPSLPWAMNIDVDYKIASKQLDNLYYDTERFVTRSVANHLNDISKIDPPLVLEKLGRWRSEKKQNKEEMDYIINHSLRTLIKKGHPETLEFLGYNLNPIIEVQDLSFKRDPIKIGDFLEFSFDIISKDETKLMIDYTVYYPSASTRRNRKTYKLKVLDIKNNETITIKGKRSFKEISTRKMRPGTHEIEIQVNGKVCVSKTFEVLEY